MDVKTTFLNCYLEEEMYVKYPQGYEIPGQDKKVYRLKKELKLLDLGTYALIPTSPKMDFIEVKLNRNYTPKLMSKVTC